MFKLDVNILVVDDMKGMRMFVKKQLKTLGFTNLFEAEDGEDAWKIIKENKVKFSIVLSDVNMPNLSGIELLKRVRADEELKDTPFMLLTAEVEKSTQSAAQEAGVTDMVFKPISAENIKIAFSKIARLLAQ